MKKLLLIGKFTDNLRQINDQLSHHCQVQLSADNREIVAVMLHLFRPEVIVISLADSSGVHGEIFNLLAKEVPAVPVLVMGTDQDRSELTHRGVLRRRQVSFLPRSAGTMGLVRRVREMLGAENGTDAAEEKRTVLVVDDNSVMLRTMQAMLSKRYKVIFATSGTQAIAAIGKTRPDIILLDYEMPVIDGRMTLQLLRSDPEMKDIPVLFLTSHADKGHVKEVLDLHPEGYLLKPPSEAVIFQRIAEVLGEDTEGMTAW